MFAFLILLTLLGGILYFLFKTVQVIVTNKGSGRSDYVRSVVFIQKG